MVKEEIYNKFLNFLNEGTAAVVKSNRDNLEDFLRDNITYERSEKIVLEHERRDKNFNIPPDIFFALSLVDYMPPELELRFKPEFTLEGILFRRQRVSGPGILEHMIPYRKEIRTYLKFQLSPDAGQEMSRSAKYAEKIVRRIRKFDKYYRQEMSISAHDILQRIKKPLINNNKDNALSFYNSIIRCELDSAGKGMGSRTKESNLGTPARHLPFCLKLAGKLDNAEIPVTEELIYESIYKILIKKTFPQIHIKETREIIKKVMDMEVPLDYREIKTLMVSKYKIPPFVIKLLNSCRYEERFKIVKKETSEQFLNIDMCHKEFKRIAGSITIKRREEDSNANNFFNLILIFNIHRKNIILLKKYKTLSNQHYFDVFDIAKRCRDILEYESTRKYLEKNLRLPLAEIFPNFWECIKKLRYGSDYNSEMKRKVWNTIKLNFTNNWLNELDDDSTKEFENSKYYINNLRGSLYNSAFYSYLKSEYKVLSEFCSDSKEWVPAKEKDGELYEIISGISLKEINQLSGVNVLNFLFKGELEENFFDEVQYILFHEKLIVVSRNGELIGLSPSKGYTELVLTNNSKDIEVSLSGAEAEAQLVRFQKILNDILVEKGKEYFNKNMGGGFIETLEQKINVKFITTHEGTNEEDSKNYELSWGSISELEQQNFEWFFVDYSFIFPAKIREVHLKSPSPKNRITIPENEKELLFYMDNRKDDNSMTTDFWITSEDIILLGRNSAFYSLILLERAFSIVFNKTILKDEQMYTDFRELIGKTSLYAAQRYFKQRGKTMTESRLLRKFFIQNSVLFAQNKKEGIEERLRMFLERIFNTNLQIEMKQ